MKPADKEFESRDELEEAYNAGSLKTGERYYVRNIDVTYRLDVTRKGFVEIPNNQ